MNVFLLLPLHSNKNEIEKSLIKERNDQNKLWVKKSILKSKQKMTSILKSYSDSEYVTAFRILYLEENLFNDSQRIIRLFLEFLIKIFTKI